MFNRFNSYSSTAFDIYKKLKRFIRTIAAYVMINDKESSLNTFIERDNNDWFIIVVKYATNKKKRL